MQFIIGLILIISIWEFSKFILKKIIKKVFKFIFKHKKFDLSEIGSHLNIKW